MLLLEQNITRKPSNETAIELDKVKSKKYEVKVIYKNTVHASKPEGYLLGLYFLVS